MKALTIKDLAVTKQLGAEEMSTVRGGSNYNIGNVNYAKSGGFASPAAAPRGLAGPMKRAFQLPRARNRTRSTI